MLYFSFTLPITAYLHSENKFTELKLPIKCRGCLTYLKDQSSLPIEYTTRDVFSYRIPNKRDCEWAIKHSWNKKLKFNENNEIWKFLDIREKLFIEIKILGEENYLFDLDSINCGSSLRRYNVAGKKKKLLYLNNSSFEEMYFDYQNFLEWKGGPNESSWSLALDCSGDAMFFSGY